MLRGNFEVPISTAVTTNLDTRLAFRKSVNNYWEFDALVCCRQLQDIFDNQSYSPLYELPRSKPVASLQMNPAILHQMVQTRRLQYHTITTRPPISLVIMDIVYNRESVSIAIP